MLEINEHLTHWLGSAARICSGSELDESLSPYERCQMVDDVYRDNFFVEYLLVYAVSEDCPRRCEFVEGIMDMETESQVYIMQVIRDHNCHSADDEDAIEKGDEGVGENGYEFNADPVLDPIHTNPTAHTADQNAGPCKVCFDKDRCLKKLQLAMNQSAAKSHDEIHRLKEEIIVQANKLCDLDQDLLEKQSIIFDNSTVLKEATDMKKKYELMLARNMELEVQVLELQDEIDLSKPLAAKLDLAEGQVERLRGKLEELVDIKQQLGKELTSHSETYDKLRFAEHEVTELRKFKVQVEEYRAQFAETCTEMEELRARLQGSESVTTALRDEIAALRGDQLEHRHQTQHLAEELRTTAEQLREKERMNGIGEGMSELNPALMNELKCLQSENRDLSEKLDQSAVDKLESLRKEITDTKCVNESLAKKWITSKDALAKAERDIQSLSYRLHDKETECLALRFQIAEQGRMNEEDVSARMLQHAREIASLRKTHADVLALTHQGHNAVLGIYSESLAEAHTTLELTQQQIEELAALQARTVDSLVAVQGELVEARRQHKCLEIEHLSVISQLNDEFSTAVNRRAEMYQSEVAQLQEECKQTLSSTIEAGRQAMKQQATEADLKTVELSALLENESKRRHTAERAKKIVELEAHRLKLQLQAAMGADAGEDERDAERAHGSPRGDCRAARAVVVHLAGPRTHSRARAPGADCLRCAGYAEQVCTDRKRIDQLMNERHDLIAKNLLEQRARHGAHQQMLVIEKENTCLHAEVRKVTLDMERTARKLTKLLEVAQSVA